MTKQTIEVEVPDGYRVTNRTDKPGMKITLDIEKIQPLKIVLEEIIDHSENSAEDKFFTGKWWREVKGTNISFTRAEPKLSLSLDDCKSLTGTKSDDLAARVRKFIEENTRC